ncbi:hypothetical protein SLE2022_011160 [Rubroshorea leprosula]
METSSSESRMATAKAIVSAVASVAATLMVARSIANDFLPHELRSYFFFNTSRFFSRFSSTVTMVIEEYDGLVYNQIYEAAKIYLGTKISPSTKRFRVSKPEKEKNFVVNMESNEEVEDVYSGVKFKWVFVCQQVEDRSFNNPRDIGSTLRSEVRSFELCFPNKHKEMVLNSYLPYIVKEAKSMVQKQKTLKIFTVEYERMYSCMSDLWKSVNLDHPATFETLAMEPELKNTILKDLDRFVKRKDYYRKVGKAWKRGYLLYGPPGTGKSSLIAAMANYLNFDVYDLELSELRCNSDLRKLLVATANRSILVVEDIDCTIELENRAAENRAVNRHGYYGRQEQQVTLSGLLNFIDGLWSSCGDERIIIFTTNHKEKLDPALLRPGRMDVHVHMSYCTPCGFRALAANYMGIEDHELFGEIEEAIRTTEVTPAEVAEQLMRNDDDLDALLSGLIQFLKVKKRENEEAKAKKNSAQQESTATEGGQIEEEENESRESL